MIKAALVVRKGTKIIGSNMQLLLENDLSFPPNSINLCIKLLELAATTRLIYVLKCNYNIIIVFFLKRIKVL